jgi:hypothetical protein
MGTIPAATAKSRPPGAAAVSTDAMRATDYQQ